MSPRRSTSGPRAPELTSRRTRSARISPSRSGRRRTNYASQTSEDWRQGSAGGRTTASAVLSQVVDRARRQDDVVRIAGDRYRLVVNYLPVAPRRREVYKEQPQRALRDGERMPVFSPRALSATLRGTRCRSSRRNQVPGAHRNIALGPFFRDRESARKDDELNVG